MRRRVRIVSIVALAAAVAGCGGDATPGDTTRELPQRETAVQLTRLVEGLDSPLQAVAVPGTADLWVVEQAGRIRRVVDGAVREPPVLDIADRVRSDGEQGLLSLALHPNFPTDGRAYVHLSDPNGDTRVEEHVAGAAGFGTGPPRVLLRVDQPYPNHNGGSLAFGPDGKLYLGLGDGGSANDPDGRSQDLDSRLGKLLRLDVDATSPAWEVAAYGLRNPWRVTFDPVTGDGWIGDVGQSDWEEIDVVPAGAGLLNFGWDVYEGRDRAPRGDPDDLDASGALTPPVAQYSHDEGCSVTGGVVVRDPGLPGLAGRYLYGDYCSGTIWSIPIDAVATPRREPFTVDELVSIDAGLDGSIHMTSKSGTIFRLTSA